MLTFRKARQPDGRPPDAPPALGRRRDRLAGAGAAGWRWAWPWPGKQLDKLPFRVWVLCGDSEMAEGSMWEAMEHAAHAGLDNLTAIIDVNRLGQTGETMHGWDLDAYARRAQVAGWHAIEIDGHDVAEIDEALTDAAATSQRPTMIVARTEKGHGVAAVANQNGAHGKPLADPEAAIAELGGLRHIRVAVAPPEGPMPAPRPEPEVVRLPAYEVGTSEATRRAYGEALAAVGSARRRGRRPGRRGQQLDVCRDLPRGASGSVLRDVHRRAAAGGGRRRPPGPRLPALRLDLRRLPVPRLRLHPDGRHQPRQHEPGGLARRGLASARTGRPRWRSRTSP